MEESIFKDRAIDETREDELREERSVVENGDRAVVVEVDPGRGARTESETCQE